MRILPVRLISNATAPRFQPFRSSAVLAINYAAMMGADIINMSVGFYGSTGAKPSNCQTSAVAANLPKEKFDTIRAELLTEMTSSVALGTSVLVPIAHNCPFNLDSGATFEWPSSFKNNQFLVVGSVDAAGTLSSFSGRGGTTVDIAAPGENYLMLVPGNGTTTSCRGQPNDCDGTSYAAPLVAGAMALVLSQNLAALRGKPCELVDRVLRNAGTITGPSGSVAGDRMLDADRAVRNVVTTPVRTCP